MNNFMAISVINFYYEIYLFMIGKSSCHLIFPPPAFLRSSPLQSLCVSTPQCPLVSPGHGIRFVSQRFGSVKVEKLLI